MKYNLQNKRTDTLKTMQWCPRPAALEDIFLNESWQWRHACIARSVKHSHLLGASAMGRLAVHRHMAPFPPWIKPVSPDIECYHDRPPWFIPPTMSCDKLKLKTAKPKIATCARVLECATLGASLIKELGYKSRICLNIGLTLIC
jgi:hypothetical protein